MIERISVSGWHIHEDLPRPTQKTLGNRSSSKVIKVKESIADHVHLTAHEGHVMLRWVWSIFLRGVELRFMWWQLVIVFPHKSFDNCFDKCRFGHIWRIIVGHSNLATSHLLIYNKHTVHTQPFKVIEKYYKVCTIRKLPHWVDHLNTCHQDNTPQTVISLPHVVPISHTKC